MAFLSVGSGVSGPLVDSSLILSRSSEYKSTGFEMLHVRLSSNLDPSAHGSVN